MWKVLIKRSIRDLAANKIRYLALAILIIFSIFMVVRMMGSSNSIIIRTAAKDNELKVEDGQFTVFVPLSEAERSKITDRGVVLEEAFYLDYEANGGDIVRLFEVRENIDLIGLVDGRLPSSDDEVVLERRYSEDNDLSTGDKITIGGKEFTVSGIGAVPDYNHVLRKISDSSVESASFGPAFVTRTSYEAMRDSKTALVSECYTYIYRLNGAMTDDELKSLLEENKYSADDVDDEFFKEYWNRMIKDRDDFLEAVTDLKDGADDLAEGASELKDGALELKDGASDLKDGASEIYDGASELSDGADELAEGAEELSDGADELSEGAGELKSGTSELSGGADTLSEGAGTLADSSAAIAPVAPELAGGIAAVSEGADALAEGAGDIAGGASGLYDGTVELADGAGSLAEGAGDLADGAEELEDGALELKDGAEELSDGAVELYDGSVELSDGADELADGMNEFYDEANDLIDEVYEIDNTNLTEFIKRADNPRIDAAADDVQLSKNAGVAVGILLMILFSYVISVFVVHSVDRESAVIGALYSLGVKKNDLMLSYVMLPVLVTFISGAAGTAAALFTPLGIKAEMADSLGYYSMPPIDPVLSPWHVVYGVVLPPVISIVVNVIVINKRLQKTPLSLLRNEQKTVKGREFHFKHMRFINVFKIRQMLRETRSGLAVVFGLFISLIIAMLAVNTYNYCGRYSSLSVENTGFEYMYIYKYPEENVPEGGYEAVISTCSKDFMSYSFDISLAGIRPDDPFFAVSKMPSSTGEAAISRSFAEKYKVNVGDVFTINDKENDRIYAFKAVGISEYTASMMVYLNIDDMRSLMGYGDDYYNAVFSDHDLGINTGRLYSMQSKADIAKSSRVFVDQMKGLIYTLSIASAVIFVMVMYLMMKNMIDRSVFNISLVKVFGYRDGEVRKMYLDGNFYIVAAGALISIFITKQILNVVYPYYLVGNVGVGISQTFPWYVYAGIYAVIIALYLVIENTLLFRIRKVTPAEVLKNRE